MQRKRVTLVQQGVWEMPLESMPLAVGYLKAAVDADEALRDELETVIVNLRGGATIGTAMSAVFAETVPDVLAITVFGWNFREAVLLAQTFKQLRPAGLVVLGGTHVANQAERVFRLCPEVDVIVNGEGEDAFPELLRVWLAGDFPARHVGGTSFRREDGTIVTTAGRAPIADLGTIVSPFLSGAIPMTDHSGRFRYDVAILETNRGCPYHCAFCYWGGAIGQKVRRFPRERLAAEIEMFAYYQVNSVILCDANFGMLPGDEEFVEDVIRIRERTGFPRAIETSWAKNKSDLFYRIVRKMKAAGMHSSFTIALQTLDHATLLDMNRRNMKLNDWKSLVEWLEREGLESYAELLWGAPGETTESFLRGYDELSLHVPRIATYPLMVLPNTDYAARREELGLVTTRGQSDDFEYVLASNSMTFQENLAMQGFLLWARSAAENSFFRHIWRPLLHYAGLTQSQVLFTLATWFDDCAADAAAPLRSPSAILEPKTVNAAVRALFLDPRVRDLLAAWWRDEIQPVVPREHQWLLDEIFRFDVLTLPVLRSEADDAGVVEENGVGTYRRNEVFAVDVPAVVAAARAGHQADPAALSPTVFEIVWRLGLESYVDNHEEALLHMGRVVGSYAMRPAGGAVAPAACVVEREAVGAAEPPRA